MTKEQYLLILITLLSVSLSKSEKTKTLIINVDESKPEETNAVFSDLNLEEQASVPSYRSRSSPYLPKVVQTVPDDKQYIVVRPVQLKNIKNLDDISIERPRYVTIPQDASEENYDTRSGEYVQKSAYPYQDTGYPPSPANEQESYGHHLNEDKYPKRPAPPLTSLYSNSNETEDYRRYPHNKYSSKNYVYDAPKEQYESDKDYTRESYETYDPQTLPKSQKFTGVRLNNYSPIDIKTYPASYNKEHIPVKEHYSSHNKDISYTRPQGIYGEKTPETGPTKSESPESYSRSRHNPKTSSYTPKQVTRSKYLSAPISYKANYRDNLKPYNSDSGKYPANFHGSDKYSNRYSLKDSSKPAINIPYSVPQNSERNSYNVDSKPLSIGKSQSRRVVPYSNTVPPSYSSTVPSSYSYADPTPYGNRKRYRPGVSTFVRTTSHQPKDYDDTVKLHEPYNSRNRYSESYKPISETKSFYGDSSRKHPHEESQLYPKPNPVSYKLSDSSYEPHNYPQSSYKEPFPDKQPIKETKDDYLGKSHYEKSPTYSSESGYDSHKNCKHPSHRSPTKDVSSDYGTRKYHSHPSISDQDQSKLSQFYHKPLSHHSLDSSNFDTKYHSARHQDDIPKSSHYSQSPSLKFTPDESVSPVSHPTHYNKDYSHEPPSEQYDGSYPQDNVHVPDSHLAKKNYKPSRPAPLYDEYDQPRHPPLPSIVNSGEHSSYEENTRQNPEYHQNGDVASYSRYPLKNQTYNYGENNNYYYPSSKEQSSQYYSGPSSEEPEDEPKVYTKTITKTYTKPSANGDQYSSYHSPETSNEEYLSKNSYDTPRSYSYESNSSIPASPYTYSETPHLSSANEYSYSKPIFNKDSKKFKYYTREDSAEDTSPHIQRPQRAQGVVYRTRKTYSNLEDGRKPKSYLPYKLYDPKSSPAYDYKVYEVPPQQNNITKSKIHKKTGIKLKYKPLKNDLRDKNSKESSDYDGSFDDSGLANIPGEAGKDYPILKKIPYSQFSCEYRAPGFYADVEHRCQVYYQCSGKGRIQSFLCPNGTIFNQETFVCEWWHNVDCEKSEKLYQKNEELYKPAPQIKSSNNDEKYPYDVRDTELEPYDSRESLENSEVYQEDNDSRLHNYPRRHR